MTQQISIIIILVITTICNGQVQYNQGNWVLSGSLSGMLTQIENFDFPFEKIPKILLFIQNIDATNNAGFEVYSSDITAKSFTLNLDIQQNDIVMIRIVWFAIVHPLIFVNSYKFDNLEFPSSTDPISSLDFILKMQHSDKVISFVNGFHFTTIDNYLQLQVTPWNEDQIKLTIFSKQATTLDLISFQIISLNEAFSFDPYQEIYLPLPTDPFFNRPTSSIDYFYNIYYPKHFNPDEKIFKLYGINGVSWLSNLRLVFGSLPSGSTLFTTLKLNTWEDTKFSLINVNYIFYQFTNAYQLSKYNNRYYPICGDGIKTYFEQCDEGLLNVNNCFYCKLQCDPTGCLKCLQDICYQCRDSYTLNGSQCIYQAQQIQLFPSQYKEQEQYQAQCQYQCEFCVEGKCLKCKLGWQLALGKCIDIVCGDSLVTKYFEECDDANTIPYDGCFQCKLECDINCTICIQGICSACNFGWYLNDFNSCYSQCGDGIVVSEYEQCDDGNNDPTDDCDNCLLAQICDLNICDLCFGNECIFCDFGYYPINGQCQPKCGDAIFISEIEECEDGNKINGDGCSTACLIEEGYICSQSMCTIYDQPYMYLSKQMINQQQSIVTVKFTQKVKIQQRLNETFQLILVNVDQSLYSQQMIIIQEVTNQLNDIQYQFFLTFNQNCVHPKAQVTCFMNLTNAYNQSVYNNHFYIILDSPQFLNELEQSISEYSFKIGTYEIYCLLSISGLGLITQNFGILMNCLDLLQSLSYLKYINFVFPENLETFFICFDMVQLQYYLNEYISQLSININLELNCLQIGKFLHYQVQSCIFYNLFSIFSLYFISLLFSLLCRVIYYQFEKINEKHFKLMSVSFFKIFLFLRKLIYNLSNTSELGLYIFLYVNAYEILFASLVQILEDNNKDWIAILGIICALLIIFKYLYNILIQFKKIHPKFPENKILCFGIKSNGSYWQLQTNNLIQLQKILFMQAITLCQDEGVIAVLEIFLIQLGFIMFLIYHNQFKLVFDSIITKGLIFISSVSIIFYSINWRDLTYQQRVYFGWATILSILLAMTFQIIVGVLQLISELRKWISKQVQLINLKKEEKRQKQQHILFS